MATSPSYLAQHAEHFASGVNNPGEVRGLAMSGRHVGITCGEIRTGLIEELENYGGPGMQCLFVDSGAFSEVEFTPEAGGFVVVDEITEAGWAERFELYRWAAATYGRRAYLVAPDRVGCQVTTLARLERYAADVQVCAMGRANIIVPIQKGELPMSEMWRRAVEILELRDLIAGVPMKKDATSLADLAELVAAMPVDARIHLLGLGPESPKYAPAIATILRIRPEARITSDSVTIRRLVGRTNGPKGGPREITRLQDEARAMGITNPAEVKAHALTIQGWGEIDRDIAEANAAGWFDDELYDSAEEAAAHHADLVAERQADRAAELAAATAPPAPHDTTEAPAVAPETATEATTARKADTMSKIAIATIMLAAAACDLYDHDDHRSPDAHPAELQPWECDLSSYCADDRSTTVSESWQLCENGSDAEERVEEFKAAWLEKCVQGTVCTGKALDATCSGVCAPATGSAWFSCAGQPAGPIGL